MDKLDQLTYILSQKGLGWTISKLGNGHETKIYRGAEMIGVYRAILPEPTWVMLYTAVVAAGINIPDLPDESEAIEAIESERADRLAHAWFVYQ